MAKFNPADKQRIEDLQAMSQAIERIKERIARELPMLTAEYTAIAAGGAREEAFNRAYLEAAEFLVLKGVAMKLERLLGEVYRAEIIEEAQKTWRQN